MPAGTNILSGWIINWERCISFGIVRIFVDNVANMPLLCLFSVTMNQTFSKDFIFL